MSTTRETALRVACPVCSAPEGQPCLTKAGPPRVRDHADRYTLGWALEVRWLGGNIGRDLIEHLGIDAAVENRMLCPHCVWLCADPEDMRYHVAFVHSGGVVDQP